MLTASDISYTREVAERKLGVRAGSLGLDQLAYYLSLEADEPVSVRNPHSRPVTHSRVYYLGDEQPGPSHLSKYR